MQNIAVVGQWITWDKTYLFSTFISGYCVKQTSDNNFIVGGYRDNYSGFVLKLNQFGDTLWLKYTNSAEVYSIIETKDNNFIILSQHIGFNNEYINLLKIKPNGETIWEKKISEIGYFAHAYYIDSTTDNSFIIAGALFTYSPTTRSAYYVKVDSNGNKIWSHFIGTQTGNKTLLHVKQTIDSGYAFVGSAIKGSMNQIYLVKTNSTGDTIWTKDYGDSNMQEGGYSVFQLLDQGYLVIGYTNTNPPSKLLFIRTDNIGNMIWTRTYSDPNYHYALFEGSQTVKNVSNNSYMISGTKTNYPFTGIEKAFLLNIDSMGNKIYEKAYNRDTLSVRSWALDICADSGFVVSGDSYSTLATNTLGIPGYLYIFKTDKFGNLNTVGINIISNSIPTYFKLHQNYPNPFNPVTNIKFDIPKDINVFIFIYDILGGEVFSINEYKKAGSYEVKFDGSNLASGMYFYKLEADGFTDTKKMVLLK